MPREVTAWESEDGRVYPTELKAAEADARYHIKQLNLFNEATVNSVIANAAALYTALEPLVRAS